ncbi:hypothetical protein B5M47_01375 [candidate division CPR3 bacterium 4484_211]|uniref:ABC transporter domain-containing protein n=1 Tax=candidate division CPR3 bacterium 4484_211 TaxID=1968527 RepID=A0A1W9NYU7_UNCC3|nr:MAG: hypothetical protein B5M47_01375 [candidate division CPR3 bacterium 4484_211]
MLSIKNLSVKVNGKKILRGIDLEIRKGETHALLGPNASGKTTLAQAIMGFPGYAVASGEICFGGKDIASLAIEERVKLGIALAFQHPPAVKGVTLSNLLGKISKRTVKTEEFIANPKLLGREINVGFSGGERKLSEIMQIVGLSPKLVVFDELDAGLDLKNLAKLARIIKGKLLENGVSLLLITHRGEILRFLEPDIVHVMLDGKIICSSDDWRKVWRTIGKFGYEKCKECEFSSGR